MISYQELADTVKDAATYEAALRFANSQLQAATNAFKSAPNLARRLAADKERKEAAATLESLKLNYYDMVNPAPDYSYILD